MDRLKNTLNIYSKITCFHPGPITHSPKRFTEISLLLRFHIKYAYGQLFLTLTGYFLHLHSILVPGFVIRVIEIDKAFRGSFGNPFGESLQFGRFIG